MTRPHGLGGAMRVVPPSAALCGARRVRIGGHEFRVRAARATPDAVLVEVEGVADRDAAQARRGAEVAVARDDLPALLPDEWYVADLVGFEAVTPDGDPIGPVRGVADYGTGELMEVGERLVPLLPGVLREVRAAERRVVLDLPEGLP